MMDALGTRAISMLVMIADTQIGSLEMLAMKYVEMAITMVCKDSGTILTTTNVTMEISDQETDAAMIVGLRRAGTVLEVQLAERMFVLPLVETGCIIIESTAMMETCKMEMDVPQPALKNQVIDALEASMNGKILAMKSVVMEGM